MKKYPGIHKLTEECGEVLQCIGKLGPFPKLPHPDGKGRVIDRLNEELTDLEAAIQYFRNTNNLDRIEERFLRKVTQFEDWGLTGI